MARKKNMEWLWFIGLLVLWLAFQLWILPKLGVST